MNEQEIELTPAQERDLKLINEGSKGGKEWMDADDFDVRVLRGLKDNQMIDLQPHQAGDGKKIVRVTGRGKRFHETGSVMPPAVPAFVPLTRPAPEPEEEELVEDPEYWPLVDDTPEDEDEVEPEVVAEALTPQPPTPDGEGEEEGQAAAEECEGDCVHARVLNILAQRDYRFAEVIHDLMQAELGLEELGL